MINKRMGKKNVETLLSAFLNCGSTPLELECLGLLIVENVLR